MTLTTRSMLSGLTLALSVSALSTACIFSKQSGSGALQTDFSVAPSTPILLSLVPDGSGADGVMVGSGELVRSSLSTELIKRNFQVQPAATSNLDQLVAEAKSKQVPLILMARITIWEDNATSWSSKRDHAGISLQLYDVATGTVKGSSDRTADGVRHPNQCAPWLAQAAISAMFGETIPDDGPPC